MTDENGHRVSLREHLEGKICALDSRINERFKARDENLVRQAEEYERRLEGLNHEQARVAALHSHYLPRELADQRQKEFEDWRDTVNKTFATSAGRTTTLVAVVAIAAGIIGAVLSGLFQ